MTQITWSDQMGSRGRRTWLLLVADGTVRPFIGKDIPGVIAVVGSDYEKNGKWSHTTYRLTLAPGVCAHPGRDGWETGTLREALSADRWVDAANALRVSVPEMQRFTREWRPLAAEHWDRVEEALTSVDEAPETPEGADVLTISYGCPTRRLREAGYWGWPVVVQDQDGNEVGRISPDGQVLSGQVRVLARVSSSGHGGGYLSWRVAAPAGCMLCHDAPDP